ncbi:PilZ domain-containing protein [Oscillospiraceae bacterium OttesenSCG-928-G22]|nr:PilZ domain-containing protein [Oscillospiraceae bacterium OttesenSCG-928-G22]
MKAVDTGIVKGDRLDIKVLDKKCQSTVRRVVTPDTYVIASPQIRNVFVPLALGDLINVVYYRGTGMFSFVAEVSAAFEEEGEPVLIVALRSPISKYQRRDFSRFETSFPLTARVLPKKERVETFDPASLVYDHRIVGKPRPADLRLPSYLCETIDISGGGMKFYSDEELPAGLPLECTVSISKDYTLTVDGEVIRTDCEPDGPHPYIVCMKYVNMDERVRRKLIHFIYHEERKALPAAE